MPAANRYDAVLIGGGIMSATLASILGELEPDWSIAVFERLDSPGLESSDPWNNAGTGHSALCELNYTPQRPDGSVDISKAVAINESFQLSRQFWSHLVETGVLSDPGTFITSVPHMSFVRGDDVDFLHARFEALSKHPLFAGMEWADDQATIGQWAPLLVAGRDPGERLAATRATTGTDVNFGALTTALLQGAAARGTQMFTGHSVKKLHRRGSGWSLSVASADGSSTEVATPFVFVGSGGGALHLLQDSGIGEGKGFGGFPVSGQWLRCTDADVIAQHSSKVYGQAAVGAPPMSVPHLDTRVIDGRKSLMFGPYAGFSPKFLKTGSVTDLPLSIKTHNLLPMLKVARDNIPLTAYLVKEVLQSQEHRMQSLRVFYPDAAEGDWELLTAGQRVQVIKKGPRGGVLQFGTELVHAGDGSIAALLGASPGASTAVDVMFQLVRECFPAHAEAWTPKLREMVPSYGTDLSDDLDLLAKTSARTNDALHLTA